MTNNNQQATSAAVVIVGSQQLQNSLLTNLLTGGGVRRCYSATSPGVPAEAGNAALLLFLVDASSLKPVDALDSIDELPIADQIVRIAFFNLDGSEDVEALAAHPAMNGAFPRDCPQDQLMKGVQAILNGEVWLPRKILERYMAKSRIYKRPSSASAAALTDREIEVLRVMATGAKNTDIAERLNLSPHTIKTHIYNIFKKINASNRLQAVNWAQENL
ncbi:MAG: LuxR C-terminal-related transcriptional regulator [Pseudomonadota bacterium]